MKEKKKPKNPNEDQKTKELENLDKSFNKRFKKKIKIVILVLLFAAIFLAALFIIPQEVSKKNYEKGVQALVGGEYDKAVAYFEKSEAEQAKEQIEYILYHQEVLRAYEEKNYQEAYEKAQLVPKSYLAYEDFLEFHEKILNKLSRGLMEKAKKAFEKFEYVGAYDYLLQLLLYDPNHEEALQLLDYYKEHAQVMEAEKNERGYFYVHGNSIKQRKYVNIDKWHEAGYTGKDVTVLHDDTGNTMHSLNCKDIIQTILPDAKIIRGAISGTTNKEGVSEAFITSYGNNQVKMSFDDFIKEYGISMINNSKTGGNGDGNSKWSAWMNNKINEYNLVTFGAAGNSGGITNRFYGSFIMVSGVYLKEDGTIWNYGSKGDIDFSMFMGFQSGTSYASPFLCGMAGLLREKYPEISQKEVYEYFKAHTQPLGDEGKNTDYGWGLPILGDPNE